MIEIRPYAQLGSAQYPWLETKHHFSFANYYDDERMHWGKLRVWNDDTIAPESGFPLHPHRDMEIITYVYQGAITHTDSMGNNGRTEAGDVQVMSAGTGVRHSEYNLEDETTKLFQIWIMPDKIGNTPAWGTKRFPKAANQAHFKILASGFAEDESQNSLPIQTSGRVLAVTLHAGQSAVYNVQVGHYIYLVAVKGQYQVNGYQANARDGVAIKNEQALTIEALEHTEIIMVDTF
ncbi:hypothetical protein DES39_1031 [Orbus hercynius]|uniref:Pirin N-terminal domain-containing protein n=1 Tax=Orbus hercynius TaxID=593135 RepID=A0A495RJU1_9GAMM|nr:pirin-like bicupin family protein [Orbus hercynius]RKS87787.1 hypothetical protein DES39_1031 [Orbus hercynius]